MKRILLLFIFSLSLLNANITKYFPELSGRIVDNANMISPSTEENISSILKAHEEETSNQIVVVTVDSLHGYPIEDFGYQLGRHWGIGQKGRDNGVLLIVSKEDRKIRIEVGYGLEGALTDKISHEIIEYVLKPKFRIQQFDQAFKESINNIIDAIKGEYINDLKKENSNSSSSSLDFLPIVFFITIFSSGILGGVANTLKSKPLKRTSNSLIPAGFVGFFVLAITEIALASIGAFVLSFIVSFLINKKVSFTSRNSSYSGSGYSGSGYSSGGGGFSSGGGFSGGGGGFGGGGASGGW